MNNSICFFSNFLAQKKSWTIFTFENVIFFQISSEIKTLPVDPIFASWVNVLYGMQVCNVCLYVCGYSGFFQEWDITDS